MVTLMGSLLVYTVLFLFRESSSASIPNVDDESTDLFEGDILLTDEVLKLLNKHSSNGVSSGESSFSNDKQSNARRNRNLLWVTKIVPYEIPASMKAEYEDTVNIAVQEFHKKSCLRFVKRTKETTWIRFVKKNGCWSSIGRRSAPGYQEVSLGHGCNSGGTAIHELMHAVGFFHEQSRPDRDRYVEIFWENIPLDKQHNFNKYSHGAIDTLGVLYDYNSIMHYGNSDFTMNGQATIRAIKQPGKLLGQRIKLSEMDVVKLNALYDCNDGSSGVWSSWSSYSPCTSQCEKYRQRFCSSSNRATDCPSADKYGIETERVKCSYQECYAPVDGHWGRWTGWGVCSTSCGSGLRQRIRSCNDPPPTNNGLECNGIKMQTKACKIRKCSLGPDDCDFDDEQGWCFWKSLKPKQPWYLQTGPTSSSDTGPPSDHGGLAGGRYIYFESSSPRKAGETGIVESKPFSPTKERCLTFYYFMYGDTMGRLDVYVRENGFDKTLWTKEGNQGQSWHKAKIPLDSDSQYKIIFAATKGSGYRSDIALDDISFREESCSPRPTTVTTVQSSTSTKPATSQPSTTTENTVKATTEEATTNNPSITTLGPVTPPPPEKHFLIYNADHNKCLSLEGSTLTASSCDPASPNKMWTWTFSGQLQNIFTLTCLTVPINPKGWDPVSLEACGRGNPNQTWTCAGEFLKLKNTILNLNYGNTGDQVVLFQGTGPWSKWKVFGEEKNVCEKREVKISTTKTPPTSQLSSSKPSPAPSEHTTAISTTPSPPLNYFLIYNTDHDKCIAFENSIVTGTSCFPQSPNKMWQWTPFGELQNLFTSECLTVSGTPEDWKQITLEACHHNDSNQKWTCAEDFLRLGTTNLNLNYGNKGDKVVLFTGSGPWSKWKVFAEGKNVCEKQKGFQIYSTVHDKCVSEINNRVVAANCDIDDRMQRWLLDTNGQVHNKETNKCLDVDGEPADWQKLRVSTCDPLQPNQRWSCDGNLIQVGDRTLNMNFGNIFNSDDVVLFRGTGTFSQWKIYGTTWNICTAVA